MFRVIIAGSRDFDDYEFLRMKVDFYLRNIEDEIEILCGMARGADLLGKRYAEEHGYKVSEYPAKWDLYGRSAGYRRNVEMAKNADALIAFWDGESRGTKHMIDIANEYHLQKRVVRIDVDKEG